MTALLAMLAVWLTPWQRQRLVRSLQNEWATVSDEEATDLAERVAALGADGIPALVAGLASERDGVVAAARQVLCREVNRWERLSTGEASMKLALLAESLAAEAERFSPPARATAADLALRMLRWPTEGAIVERSRLVADCERVLRTAGDAPAANSAQGEVARHGSAARRGTNDRWPVQRASFKEFSDATARSMMDLAEHRSSAEHHLPSGLVEPQPLGREPSDDVTLLAGHSEPGVLVPDPATRRLPSTGQPLESPLEVQHAIATEDVESSDDSLVAPATFIDGRADALTGFK